MIDAADGTLWAAIGAGATALVGGVVKIVGSRKERSADTSEAAREWRAVAERCEERETRHEERVAHHESAIDALRTDLRTLEDRHAELARVHAACPTPAEFSRMRREVDRLSMQSTPPSGLYVPDDVRAAMAQEEQP